MKISEQTKISEIIKENKSAIDAIASVAPPLHRLKNPILRKVMASRVSIAEAAKMGGCKPIDIINVLIPLGFEYESNIEMTKTTNSNDKPLWLQNINDDLIVMYDVRPIIESGTDPLKAILGKFKDVVPGGVLCIINSFVPTPLIHLLKQEKAEDSYVDIINPNESHTYFLKKQKEATTLKSSNEKVIMEDEASFKVLYNSISVEKIREIDVRHLEMPGPMETILSTLASMTKDEILYVNHKRVPVYLLEELADKSYESHIWTVDELNVKMLIFER